MGDDTPEKDLPGRQVMEALGWEAGPEQLERHLEAFYHSFVAEGRQHTEAAFSAISEIALHHWHTAGRQEAEFGGLDPLSRIPVPWWILWALSTGWSEYIDAKGTVTLGKAFGLEGLKHQGSHRTVSKLKTESRRRGYALEVAWEIEQGAESVEAAQALVAERYGISKETVKKAWKQHGRKSGRAVSRKG